MGQAIRFIDRVRYMYNIVLRSLFSILTVWVIEFIACMVGMMAAMAMGTILTLWLPGHFFQSTGYQHANRRSIWSIDRRYWKDCYQEL
jgi:integral membrane sensor domain MASE1